MRGALGPAAASRLRTVPRRGYLFAEARPDAVAKAVATVPDGHGAAPDDDPLRLRRDGIAVLPFITRTAADPGDAILLDGLVHDIISRLARLRSFHVIARGSTFSMRHLGSDPRTAGRALGVAHVVTGTGEVRGDQVHLCVDLVDVETGSILWTEDLTSARGDFLALLPQITQRIAGVVEAQVTTAEMRRALAMPTERLDAWETYHAGLHDALRFDPERIDRALVRLRDATARDPRFARAHAGQSFCHYYRAFAGIAADRNAEIALARRSAEEALQADPSNPTAHWAFGRALWLGGDPEGCLRQCEWSVAQSPGFALGHYMLGFVETHCGDARRGLSQMDRVLALSPYDPFRASVQITRAIALVRLGQPLTAAAAAREAARQPNAHAYPMLLAPAALILAGAGYIDEARRIVAKLRETDPNFRSDKLHQSLPRTSDDVVALFRKTAPVLGL